MIPHLVCGLGAACGGGGGQGRGKAPREGICRRRASAPAMSARREALAAEETPCLSRRCLTSWHADNAAAKPAIGFLSAALAIAGRSAGDSTACTQATSAAF